MPSKYIIAIGFIAITIAIVISTMSSTSRYLNFEEVFELSDKNNSEWHVVTTLKRDSANELVGFDYNPLATNSYLSFIAVDDKDREERVICYDPPVAIMDLKRSDRVLLIGRAKDESFIASKILLKCPSKYSSDPNDLSSMQ